MIRTNFVSNSSSSSFICVFGKVKDEEKIKEILSNTRYDYDIDSGEEFLEKYNHSNWSMFGECDWAGVSLRYDIKSKEIKPDDKIFTMECYGGAGCNDSDFMEDEDDWECNYSVSYEDFDERENIEKIREYLSDVVIDFGAGRDG